MKSIPIDTDAQRRALAEHLALDSRHSCYRPTHLLVDDQGDIRGAFSTAFAPVLFFWMDPTDGDALASRRGYELAEQEFRRLGHRAILLPVQYWSPFYPFVAALGYTKLGECELHEKVLA